MVATSNPLLSPLKIFSILHFDITCYHSQRLSSLLANKMDAWLVKLSLRTRRSLAVKRLGRCHYSSIASKGPFVERRAGGRAIRHLVQARGMQQAQRVERACIRWSRFAQDYSKSTSISLASCIPFKILCIQHRPDIKQGDKQSDRQI